MIKEFAKKTIYFYMCMYIGIFCTEKKSLKVSKGDNINFRFYFRDFGCNNGNCTYSDELAIENYVDNSLTVRELSKIALAYVDTAKADLPISSICFIGELQEEELPTPLGKNVYEYADNIIVTFAFNNSLSAKPANKEIAITNIVFKKNGNLLFLNEAIDSVLNSKVPLRFDN